MGKTDKISASEEMGRNQRALIYDKSVELFEQKGFDNIKVSDICRAADISVGTFYYYFPSKESIFLEYGNLADEKMAEIYKNLADLPAKERLQRLIVEKILFSTSAGPELCNVSLIACLKHHTDNGFDLHHSYYGLFSRTVEAGIREGSFRRDINLYDITSALRYMIGGLVAHWAIIGGEQFDIREEAEALSNSFVRMLCRTEE